MNQVEQQAEAMRKFLPQIEAFVASPMAADTERYYRHGRQLGQSLLSIVASRVVGEAEELDKVTGGYFTYPSLQIKKWYPCLPHLIAGTEASLAGENMGAAIDRYISSHEISEDPIIYAAQVHIDVSRMETLLRTDPTGSGFRFIDEMLPVVGEIRASKGQAYVDLSMELMRLGSESYKRLYSYLENKD